LVKEVLFFSSKKVLNSLRKFDVEVGRVGRLGYPTLNRRIRNLTISTDIDASSDIYELAIDSTGYKFSNRENWISESWKMRRGYKTTYNCRTVDVRFT
jgi:hypothetical protein